MWWFPHHLVAAPGQRKQLWPAQFLCSSRMVIVFSVFSTTQHIVENYWAVQWSWFTRVNALCNRSRKKWREVAASLPGRFLSRRCFTLCITMEIEPRITKRVLYLSLHCHHQNDFCIKMGSGESHFNVSFRIVRDKVTRQSPQTTIFEEKGGPKRIRTEVPLLTSLTPYR